MFIYSSTSLNSKSFSNYFAVHPIRKQIPNFIRQNFLANKEELCLYVHFFAKTTLLVKNFMKIRRIALLEGI